MKIDYVYGSTYLKKPSDYDIWLFIPCRQENWEDVIKNLSEWVEAIVELPKNVRVAVLILINDVSCDNPKNQEVIKKIQWIKTKNMDYKDSALDRIRYTLWNPSIKSRVTILMWEEYHPRMNIWTARHICARYLKTLVKPDGMIWSTDADTYPEYSDCFSVAQLVINPNNNIHCATWSFRTQINSSDPNIEKLHEYESIMWHFIRSFIFSTTPERSKKEEIENLLTNTPGSNIIFRAWLYEDVASFQENWTGEDSWFSMQFLSQNLSVIHNPWLKVITDFRPSQRTENGLWTSIHDSLNTTSWFVVKDPRIIILGHLLHYVVKMAGLVTINNWGDYFRDLIEKLLWEDFLEESEWKDVFDIFVESKWLIARFPHLNDTLMLYFSKKLNQKYSKIWLTEAYKYLIDMYLMEFAKTDAYLHQIIQTNLTHSALSDEEKYKSIILQAVAHVDIVTLPYRSSIQTQKTD